MEIIADTVDFYIRRETAVAIGKFDGIHIGHRRLLEEILSRKKAGLAACVFTFDPSPAVFFGLSDGRELTTREEKRLLFDRMGVDILIEFPLDRKTADMPPKYFAREILAWRTGAHFLAAGTDLSFGARGAGDAALLHRLGIQFGFDVMTIDKVCLEGREVSSTFVREQVEQGRMEAACRLLGMPYMIAGKVVRGNGIGHTLGFPTVNVMPADNKMLPPKGVYFSAARVKGRLYRAITNIGCKPTVTDEGAVVAESYLYDFGEDIYGDFIEIYLQAFHRQERRFRSVEELREQLDSDIAAGLARKDCGKVSG